MPQGVVSHNDVLRLAWPMIVSNCSIPLLGIVDTALLGHLNSPIYLGAVAVGASILTFLLWGLGFLRMGTTSQVAQAFGRVDQEACSLLLLQSLALASGLGLLLIVLQSWVFGIALYLMAPAADIAELARSYCMIRVWSAPATLVNFVLVGWFIGMQRTREPLLIMVFTNVLNIGLDWLFIVVFEMDSDGAALATAIAEYSGMLWGFTLIGKQGLVSWRRIKAQLLPLSQFVNLLHGSSKLLRVHGDLFTRTIFLLLTFSFFTRQGAQQGETILAANAILLQLMFIVAYGLDGFAHAAEALIGKFVGGKNYTEFFQACRLTALWSLWTALGFTAVFLLLQQPILSLFTDIDAVKSTAGRYLPWLLAMPLISVWCYWLDGVFIGAGHTKAMRNTLIVASLLIFLPIWWFTQQMDNHGLWLAFVCFNGARGLLLGYIFLQLSRTRTWF